MRSHRWYEGKASLILRLGTDKNQCCTSQEIMKGPRAGLGVMTQQLTLRTVIKVRNKEQLGKKTSIM
jgi:hypothetical protein